MRPVCCSSFLYHYNHNSYIRIIVLFEPAAENKRQTAQRNTRVTVCLMDLWCT